MADIDLAREVQIADEGFRRLQTSLMTLFLEVAAERVRQDLQWGGADHDDEQSAWDWYAYRKRFEERISACYVDGACVLTGVVDDSLVKLIALGVAQLEAHRRRYPK